MASVSNDKVTPAPLSPESAKLIRNYSDALRYHRSQADAARAALEQHIRELERDRARMEEIRAMLKSSRDVVASVRCLLDNHNSICDNLQRCCQRHDFGRYGERVDVIVVDALDAALSAAAAPTERDG